MGLIFLENSFFPKYGQKRPIDKVWYAGFLHKFKYYGISSQIFGLTSSFFINRQLQVILDVGVHGSILGPALFLLYISELPDDVVCNIATYADVTALYSKCDQAFDLWQQLELASELESDLRDWDRKWLVDFNGKKLNLFCLTSLLTLVLLL